jgi:hypothetical protein
MAESLDGRLVVALSSRALFDFEEENRLFEAGDDRAYMALQQQRIDEGRTSPAWPSRWSGSCSPSTRPARRRASRVVMLSRNDPISGLRVYRSAQAHGLPIQRGVFTPRARTLALPAPAAGPALPQRQRGRRARGAGRGRAPGARLSRPVPTGRRRASG